MGEVEKQNLTRPSEFEASPDKNSMTRKISQSVENMSDNPMKPADDKIFEKNEDPDMADESDFINELDNIIKEFEDEELKKEVGEIKATGGKQIKLNGNEPKEVKEKKVKEEINKPQCREEQAIDA